MPTENRLLNQRDSYTLQQTVFTGGAWKTTTTFGAPTTGMRTETSRVSTNTPKFRSKLRPIPLPVNPFSFTQTISRFGVGWKRDESAAQIQGRPQVTNVYSGLLGADVPPFNTAPAAEVNAMDRKMVNDLLLRIKNQKVNLWQAYAERDQTARLVGDSAVRLANALRALRRGDIRSAGDALGIKVGRKYRYRFESEHGRDQWKAMSSGWLELQYGWRPLVGDVYGAAEALAHAHHGIPREKVTIRRALSGERTSTSQPNTNTRIIDVVTYDVQLRYGCIFTAQGKELKTLSELGITNPALIGWELMPWSFIIDWFIPIGDYVASWDATLGLAFKQGYKTEFRREKTVRETIYGPGNGTGGKLFGREQSSIEKVTCVRTKLLNFPSAQIPNFQNPASVQHMLNAIALLQQFR